MKNFTESLKKSIDDKNWYSALFIALSLPDICGKIDNPKENSRKRYEAWFKEYIEPKYTFGGPEGRTRKFSPSITKGQKFGTLLLQSEESETFLSGSDCYALRCAFLHEGSEDISGQKAQERIKSFEFIAHRSCPDGNMGLTLHCNMDAKRNVLQLQVDIFCQDILDGVEKWISAKNPIIFPSFKIIDLENTAFYRFPPDEFSTMTNEDWVNYLKKTL